MGSLREDAADVEPLAVLSRFRVDFHACLTARADELRELAMRCCARRAGQGPGWAVADGRSTGAVTARCMTRSVTARSISAGRRRSLVGLALPRAADGRLVLAADVSNWLRPGAGRARSGCSATCTAAAKGQAQMITGRPYSWSRRWSRADLWTAVLDAVRLGPDDDATEVTAAQLRDVVTRLIAAGHWRQRGPGHPWSSTPGTTSPGRPGCWPTCRWSCSGGCARTGSCGSGAAAPARDGRPALAAARTRAGTGPSDTCPTRGHDHHGDLPVRDAPAAAAWDRMHPRLTHRAGWLDDDGPLPVIEGTLIRLQVDHLPGDRTRNRCGCGGHAPVPRRPT